MESLASKYFGEGFDFYKRQLAHQHPNLSIDLDDMGIDHDLLEEEEDEAYKKGENKEKVKDKGDTSPFSPWVFVYFCKFFSFFLGIGHM